MKVSKKKMFYLILKTEALLSTTGCHTTSVSCFSHTPVRSPRMCFIYCRQKQDFQDQSFPEGFKCFEHKITVYDC